MLGRAYLKTKNYDRAADVFARVMAVNPNSAEAHMFMGMAYDKMDREADAEKEYVAAAKADSTVMGVHSGLGLIYLREGKMDSAAAQFRAELSRYPNDSVSNGMLGEILRKRNDAAEAIPYLRKALASNPKYKEALFELGKSETMVDQTAEAIEPLREAIALDPNYYEAHYALGSAYRKLGRTAEATRELRTAEEIQARQRAGLIDKVSKPKDEQ
jgi:protein O-GlcNAc transferase